MLMNAIGGRQAWQEALKIPHYWLHRLCALPPVFGDITSTPGLQNKTGEYNCFLNVIVQCLWHCASFRTLLMALSSLQCEV